MPATKNFRPVDCSTFRVDPTQRDAALPDDPAPLVHHTRIVALVLNAACVVARNTEIHADALVRRVPVYTGDKAVTAPGAGLHILPM